MFVKGVSLLPAFTRRVLGLLLLGFVHAIFLSTRDILIFYGLAGAGIGFVVSVIGAALTAVFRPKS